MDSEKIGNFIARLRKAKNLTQQDLGDMVGVGGKSVSKWERGINMPDVSIIPDICKILGITSNELLNGEFDKHSKHPEYLKKRNTKRLIIILSFVFVFLITSIIILLIYFKNDTHEYWISSDSKDFNVEGTLKYDKKGYEIRIDQIDCRLVECGKTYIKEIKYLLLSDETLIYRNILMDVDSTVKLRKFLTDRKIYIAGNYKNDVITYSLLENHSNLFLCVEVKNTNGDYYNYVIPLKLGKKD